ncbi:MAG: LysE family transporter [Pseudotabrizicola sp.]|uniref:LysE family transporter n=1 Tax=Pseudotabrizicola sp. TaxID=2939647 RepID=UPI00271B14AA|nr:LysE family transporter [Pseudotabrizicola sp.]MDO9638404.1 LysE family transporter [Pseudotabrizicola sp.]
MSLIAFALAYALITITPGPNFLTVLHCATTGTRGDALRAALGVGAGAASLAALVLAVGQHLPLNDSTQPYLRLLFAALLIRGGLICFAFQGIPGQVSPLVGDIRRGGDPFLRGMTVAICNPFTGIFVLSASATLINAGAPATVLTVALSIFVIAGGWLAVIAVAATSGMAARAIGARSELISACVGFALIGMAVHVVSGLWIN